jgi:hypothetical protein
LNIQAFAASGLLSEFDSISTTIKSWIFDNKLHRDIATSADDLAGLTSLVADGELEIRGLPEISKTGSECALHLEVSQIVK